MKSQHLLSPQAFLFLTSQHEKLGENFNKSEYITRIRDEIAKAFKTFEIVLDSKEISEKQMDEFFSHARIESVLDKLTDYSFHRNIISDQNGLDISESMLDHGFKYFLRRYQKTKLLSKYISEMKLLIDDLKIIAMEEKKDEQKSEVMKYKKHLGVPPKVIAESHDTALCMICWAYGSGNNEKEAIRKVRHIRGCTFDKNDPDRCFKVFRPRGKRIPLTS